MILYSLRKSSSNHRDFLALIWILCKKKDITKPLWRLHMKELKRFFLVIARSGEQSRGIGVRVPPSGIDCCALIGDSSEIWAANEKANSSKSTPVVRLRLAFLFLALRVEKVQYTLLLWIVLTNAIGNGTIARVCFCVQSGNRDVLLLSRPFGSSPRKYPITQRQGKVALRGDNRSIPESAESKRGERWSASFTNKPAVREIWDRDSFAECCSGFYFV